MPRKKANIARSVPGWGRLAIEAIGDKQPPVVMGESAPPPESGESESDYAMRLKNLGAKNKDIADYLGRTERAITAKLIVLRDKSATPVPTGITPKKSLTGSKQTKASDPYDQVLAGLLKANKITLSQIIEAIVKIDQSNEVLLSLRDSLTAEMIVPTIMGRRLSEAILTQLLAK